MNWYMKMHTCRNLQTYLLYIDVLYVLRDSGIAERRVTDEPCTVLGFDTTTYTFMTWIAQTHPQVETWVEVTREQVMAYAKGLENADQPSDRKAARLRKPTWPTLSPVSLSRSYRHLGLGRRSAASLVRQRRCTQRDAADPTLYP
jgi:hypothetical protein